MIYHKEKIGILCNGLFVRDVRKIISLQIQITLNQFIDAIQNSQDIGILQECRSASVLIFNLLGSCSRCSRI